MRRRSADCVSLLSYPKELHRWKKLNSARFLVDGLRQVEFCDLPAPALMSDNLILTNYSSPPSHTYVTSQFVALHGVADEAEVAYIMH
jgi:hypothetical protein